MQLQTGTTLRVSCVIRLCLLNYAATFSRWIKTLKHVLWNMFSINSKRTLWPASLPIYILSPWCLNKTNVTVHNLLLFPCYFWPTPLISPCVSSLQRACWGRPAVQTACAPERPWSLRTSRVAPNCGTWLRTTTTQTRGKGTEGARWFLRSTWPVCWPPRYQGAVHLNTRTSNVYI